MNRTTTIIVGIIVAIGLFWGGYAYGKSATSPTSSARTGAFTRTGGRTASSTASTTGFGGFGSGATTGTIVSADSNSITVALQSGSVVVFYSTSTPITETVPAPSSAITAGAHIVVTGTTNSDGSMTASSIQIRPSTGQ